MKAAVAVSAVVMLYPRLGRGGLAAASPLVAATLHPALGAAAAAGLTVWLLLRRITRRRREATEIEEGVASLADLVAIGLRAGMGANAALARAVEHVPAPLGAEVAAVAAGMSREGSAVALAAADGAATDLYRLMARATHTGAPLAPSVEAFAAERRDRDHARHLAELKRLPVRMLLPLALLLLPGFVLLAVGPALLEAIERLGPLP